MTCCTCDAPCDDTSAMIVIDLTVEARGAHYPLCSSCYWDETHRTKSLPSHCKIAPRRFLDDLADPAHRGGPRV